jgi:hypothetical protein
LKLSSVEIWKRNIMRVTYGRPPVFEIVLVIDRWGRVDWPFTKQDNALLLVHVKIENEAIPAYIDTGDSHIH